MGGFGWWRRLPAAGLAVGALLTGLAAGAPPQLQTRCKITDDRLTELSGLAADANHWYAINDGGSQIRIFVLGKDCSVQQVITNPTDPYDTEDLALAADGTFWLSDTGDNNHKRKTVALISVTPGGKATIHRLTYPDGPHDTEALVLDKHGVPLLITKVPLGNSEIYRPEGALAAPGPTPLEDVGSLQFASTGTPGGPVLNSVSNVLVTGAAVSADGTVVALRTYTDAYLYSAPDGDLLAALKREPVRIPLPNEEQGEGLAFEPDGTLLSGGEGANSAIRAVPHAAALVAPAPPAANAARPDGTAPVSAQQHQADQSGLPLLAVGGVAVGAFVLVVLVLGVRGRRRLR